MRKKIAVVGDKGSVLGFKSVGFEVFMATTQQEIQDVMHTLCKGDYGIIFITEQAYVQIPEIIDEYKEAQHRRSSRSRARTAALELALKMSRRTSRELLAQTFSLMKINFNTSSTFWWKPQTVFCGD